MATSYAELIQPVTEDEELTTLLELATLAEFPATSWQSGSVPRTLLELAAKRGATLANLIREIALGGMLDEATGDWLTLLAASVFDVQRLPAVRTRGQVVLTCLPTAGPYTIAVGQITVADISGHLYTNTIGGTLAAGGTLTLTFEATIAGSDHNVGNNALTRMLTPLVGVTVNNPLIVGSTTWITQNGTDVETDEQVRLRCKSKWATIGTGATADTFRFWATTANPEVKRVNVLEHSNLGTPEDGHVTVYLAGDGGIVGPDALAAVQAYVAVRRPLCVTEHIENSTASATPVTATVYCRAGTSGAVAPAVQESLRAYFRSIPIGGTIYRAGIIEALMVVEDVVNVVVSAPGGDILLSENVVATWHESPPLNVVEL